MLKKAFTIFTAFTLVIFFAGIWPNMALAAWSATDDFESGYSDNTSIDTVDGGTGWGAWSATSGNYKSKNAATINGSWFAEYSTMSALDAATNRTLDSTVSAGTFRIVVRRTDLTNGRNTFGLHDSGGTRGWFFRFNGADQTHANTITFEGASVIELGAVAANTTYTLDLTFDHGTHLAHAQLNCGTATSDIAEETTISSAEILRLNATDLVMSGVFQFDDIGPGGGACGGGGAVAVQAVVIWFWSNDLINF